MQNTVTISRETFAALLSFAKSARNGFEDSLRNSSRQLNNFPNEKHWQDSVKFWQEEVQSAENTYKKALEEAVYS
jgi:capsule polysaccharide export protein KpsE/RkpR